ncbi:MAG TPA: sorbosone dehydrogenase family protein [Tahibacter sp.]|uniref:PQQ-dependent sugar dehydrogenase n=1 Tax=Tahibacter sp. TaxID=2056211 RepID=UPI002D1A1594|nr:sorbosone dehydrogenase family protein [Tahibacter sp.]HSX60884.1 sorbosone dehydrogenase family protein [Tahibacter sp.]
MRIAYVIPLLCLSLTACVDRTVAPARETVGTQPALPAPDRSLVPTIKIAPAVGWSDGATPQPAAGLAVDAFATGLDHPRWLHVLPNGDVLVAETNAPPKADANKGIKAWFKKRAMKKAGAAVPSANRITLLRDADGDGRAEQRSVFVADVNSPFGMALVGDAFYVAASDALLRYRYRDGATALGGQAERIVELPAGRLNHHWTKNVIASADGRRLYVTVGSNSNVAENGMDKETDRAAILEVDPDARRYRVFASGLRNPNGLAWEPATGTLWTVVNERDELGDDLVPDYLTSVRDGGFYGWPYSYFGSHVDTRVKPPRPDLVARAIVPDYALGAHVAALGLVHSAGNRLPSRYREGMFIGEHGSWNRKPPSGYKVVFVAFSNGRPDGQPQDVLTGFLDAKGNARGRPVGVAIDRGGALLVADDVGNAVWRVRAAEQSPH